MEHEAADAFAFASSFGSEPAGGTRTEGAAVEDNLVGREASFLEEIVVDSFNVSVAIVFAGGA